MIRNNWTQEEIQEMYNLPLLELVYRAATVHREYNSTAEVQVCTLLSVKTGGCSEDCAYCPQAARYHTDIKVHALMQTEEVLRYAKKAKQAGLNLFLYGSRLA
jgi:biotin synthase